MVRVTPRSDCNPLSDLELRLARYRDRVAAEGRKAAVRSIDQAINEERKRGTLEVPISDDH